MKRFILAAAVLWCVPAYAQQPNAPTGQAVSGVASNRSTVIVPVSITTGNAFQTVLASNFGTAVQRQQLTVNNNNGTDNCWLYLGSGTATKALSILLTPGQSYRRDWPFVPSDTIQATCVSTADTLYVDYQ